MRNRLLILFFIYFPLSLSAQEYHTDRAKKNLVKFISQTSIESFEGTTNKIDGYLYFKNDVLTEESKLYFEVDLNTLDTGIGLRNRHMRDNYLETDKYQYASYQGSIKRADRTESGDYAVTAEGTMSIHGVVRPITVQGIIKRSGTGFQIISDFNIKLSDYKIEIPKIMFLKLNDLIQLKVNFFMKAVKS